MLRDIALFINGDLGLRIAEHVAIAEPKKLIRIFINSKSKQSQHFETKLQELLNQHDINFGIVKVWNQSRAINIESIQDLPTELIGISALFGHILPTEIIDLFRSGVFNLHPSLLPIGRGADPIPWGIIDDLPQGASIHRIDAGIDTGHVVANNRIETTLQMTSGEIYLRAMEILFNQFKDLFPKMIAGAQLPSVTSGVIQTFHNSKELKELIEIRGDELFTAEQLVRRIQALSFADGRSAKFSDKNGKFWKLQVNISPVE
jgi:methionyl-tRNA formyltransferase